MRCSTAVAVRLGRRLVRARVGPGAQPVVVRPGDDDRVGIIGGRDGDHGVFRGRSGGGLRQPKRERHHRQDAHDTRDGRSGRRHHGAARTARARRTPSQGGADPEGQRRQGADEQPARQFQLPAGREQCRRRPRPPERVPGARAASAGCTYLRSRREGEERPVPPCGSGGRADGTRRRNPANPVARTRARTAPGPVLGGGAASR